MPPAIWVSTYRVTWPEIGGAPGTSQQIGESDAIVGVDPPGPGAERPTFQAATRSYVQPDTVKTSIGAPRYAAVSPTALKPAPNGSSTAVGSNMTQSMRVRDNGQGCPRVANDRAYTLELSS